MTDQQPSQFTVPPISATYLFVTILQGVVMLLLPIPLWFLDMVTILNSTLALVVLCIALYNQRLSSVASFAPLLGLSAFFRFALSVSIYRYFFAIGLLGPHPLKTASDLMSVPKPLFLDIFINMTGGGNIIGTALTGSFICLFPALILPLVYFLLSGIPPKAVLQARPHLFQQAKAFQNLRGTALLLGIEAILGLVLALTIASISITFELNGVAYIKLFQFPWHADVMTLGPRFLSFCLLLATEVLVRGLPLILISIALWVLLTREDDKPRSLGEQIFEDLYQHPYSLLFAAFALYMITMFNFLMAGPNPWFLTMPFAGILFFIAFFIFLEGDLKTQLDQSEQAIAQHKEKLGIIKHQTSSSPLVLEVSEELSRRYQLHYINDIFIDEVLTYLEPKPHVQGVWQQCSEIIKYGSNKMRYRRQQLLCLFKELKRESSLLNQLKALYHSLVQEYGYAIIPVQIRVNHSLNAGSYQLKLIGKILAQEDLPLETNEDAQQQVIQTFLSQMKILILENADLLLTTQQVNTSLEQVKRDNEVLINTVIAD